MSKALVIANWKMNPATFKEAKALLAATKKAADKSKCPVVVAPPTVFLRDLAASVRGKSVSFGLQHGRAEEEGAHTGDTSMLQARDSKASYVIIGHAERRGQGETDADTRAKVAAALKAGLTPILCIGETSRGADGAYLDIVATQLATGLADVPATRLPRVIVVYEPLWTIGASTTMRPHDMHEMAIFIRKTAVGIFGEVGHKLRVLYGGSVNAENVRAMLGEGAIDGLLVGRASTDGTAFAALLHAIVAKR